MAGQQMENPAAVGGGSGVLRFYWMALGNLALLVIAMLISQKPTWTITVLDAAFFGVVLTLFVARYLDVKRFGGETANGQPATGRDLVHYGVGLVAVAAGLWGLVQAVEG